MLGDHFRCEGKVFLPHLQGTEFSHKRRIYPPLKTTADVLHIPELNLAFATGQM